MPILKLKPSCKDYLWGGHRLVEDFNIQYDGKVLAEAWELSCHPDGPSMIENGQWKGKTLAEYIQENGKEVLGLNCKRFKDFPILIKFIDAKDNLSIQVHPSNAYALKNEGQYGKTEMWYILDAQPGAFLYCGFDHEISKEEFERRIKENTLLEVLHPVEVHKGDTVFIESGTLHAIGKGIMIAEIQQNSNVTYRVYDYGRVGQDGKQRELHVEKAVAVTKRECASVPEEQYPHLGTCDNFTVDRVNLDGGVRKKISGFVSEASFLSILVVDGNARLHCEKEMVEVQKGDSLFLPANSGDWEMEGNVDCLLTTVRKGKNLVNVTVKETMEDVEIVACNEDGMILAKKHVAKDLMSISTNIYSMLDEINVGMDQCEGVNIEGSSMEDLYVSLQNILPCPVNH